MSLVRHKVLEKAVGVAEQSCLAKEEETCRALGAGRAYLGGSLIANMELLNGPWSSPWTQARQ